MSKTVWSMWRFLLFLALFHGINLSLHPWKRILNEKKMKRSRDLCNPNEVIDVVEIDIQGNRRCLGYRKMHRLLRNNHSLVTSREIVQLAVKERDPVEQLYVTELTIFNVEGFLISRYSELSMMAYEKKNTKETSTPWGFFQIQFGKPKKHWLLEFELVGLTFFRGSHYLGAVKWHSHWFL